MASERERQSGWLFIAGTAPRTGTTLMAWLLNLHPQVHVFCETLFPLALHGVFRPGSGLEPGRLLPEIAAQRAARAGGGNEPGAATNGGAVECARVCCEGLRSLWEPLQWFGDKAPAYAHHWPTLRALFPGCRLIVMDRPVEEVLPSIRSCDWPWLAGKSDEDLRALLSRWRDGAEQIPGALRVDMRTLSDQPERVIGEVLDWLDLDPDLYPWPQAIGQVLEPVRKVN